MPTGLPRLDTAKLRKRRLEAGMTQADLAQATELSASAISDLEGGRRNGQLETHKKLAKALGCAHTDLYEAGWF